ncbi:MAG: polysaccharide deacetylase family protein [Opitutales bacterium]
MKALVSIHDLMPETMPHVEAILELLAAKGIAPITLLVVPGKPWTAAGVERLRALGNAGHTLAAHGWRHHTRPRTLYHRLHAALLSRQVAEHLDLDSHGILDLLHRSRDWFADQDLAVPKLYVPPAWALGSIRPEHLTEAPFKIIETTRGLLYPHANGGRRRETLPLAGFECDTPLRAYLLRRWNTWQIRRAKHTDQPLRISIHPHDLELPLRDQLESWLEHDWTCLHYPG